MKNYNKMDQLWKRKLYPILYQRDIWENKENNVLPTHQGNLISTETSSVVSEQTPEELKKSGNFFLMLSYKLLSNTFNKNHEYLKLFK